MEYCAFGRVVLFLYSGDWNMREARPDESIVKIIVVVHEDLVKTGILFVKVIQRKRVLSTKEEHRLTVDKSSAL